MRYLYNIFVYTYFVFIHIASFYNKKAKQWVIGRKECKLKWDNIKANTEPLAWFHAASLGEFEQGRPVIELFKQHFPNFKIMVTFFSPSGYNVRKNYSFADWVLYLPIDTPAQSKEFIELVKPKVVFFIKYEFWFNYLNKLYQNNIPFYLVSAIFRPNQIFFKFYGKWFLKHLNYFSHIFVQNKMSENLLNFHGISNVSISGDTRFDRVRKIAHEHISIPIIEKFIEHKKVFIAGSTWEEDEKIIISLMKEKTNWIKYIIAPHETKESNIKRLIKLIPLNTIEFSKVNDRNIEEYDCLIIDSVGILSKLYYYATICYIGGGFGRGIHNILEAAVYGKPVIFGKNCKNFSEAVELLELGSVFSIRNFEELSQIVGKLLSSDSYYNECSKKSFEYISYKTGATTKIVDYLKLHVDLS